ncbi:MAG: hypothetical protein HY744_22655 [Deltaproteobacteria bacterium]|nr:hypothetical protein [Deltaproteobacteria bacterium]
MRPMLRGLMVLSAAGALAGAACVFPGTALAQGAPPTPAKAAPPPAKAAPPAKDAAAPAKAGAGDKKAAPEEKKAAAPEEKKAAAPDKKGAPADEKKAAPDKKGAPADAKKAAPEEKGAAPGDAADELKKQAKAIFEEGKAKFDQGDIPGALELFQKAEAMVPGAAPKHRIAVCLDQIGRVEEAVAAYERFLASNPGEKFAAKVEEAQARLKELQQKLPAVVTLEIEPAGAPGVHVTVDDVPLQGTELKIPAGKHAVVVTALGYQRETYDLSVTAGEKRPLKLTLKPIPEQPPPPPPKPAGPAPAEGGDGTTLTVAGAVALGVGVAAGAVGAIFGVKALGAKSDFDEKPNADSADEQESAALLADIFIPIAGVAGAAGAVLLGLGLTAGGDAAGQAASALPKVAPYVGPTGGAVAATWRF